MRHGLKWMSAAAGLVLAACASTEGSKPAADAAPPAPVAVAGSPFSSRDDGGIWHPASKGQCPAKLAGFDFKEPTLFKPDGTDVGCQYGTEDSTGFMTVYFYLLDGPATSLEAAQGAASAIVQRFPEAQYLKDESFTCSTTIDLMSGLVDSLLDKDGTGDNTIVVGKTPCFLFDIDYGVTGVATDKIDPWHLKVRITLKGKDGDVDDMITRMSDAMRQEASWMSGEPSLKLDELLKQQDDDAAAEDSDI